MKRSRFLLFAVLSAALLAGSAQAGPKVLMKTTKGDITLELDSEKAPETVKNFLAYVEDGFFNKTIFHRVIDNFMIQGGGFGLKEDGTIEQKPTKASIPNEGKNGLKNERGTIAMARTGDPNSATSQFFINLKVNDGLDYPSPDGAGYAVFGKIVEGMDVVDAIAKVATEEKKMKGRYENSVFEKEYRDVPVENVVIESASVASE